MVRLPNQLELLSTSTVPPPYLVTHLSSISHFPMSVCYTSCPVSCSTSWLHQCKLLLAAHQSRTPQVSHLASSMQERLAPKDRGCDLGRTGRQGVPLLLAPNISVRCRMSSQRSTAPVLLQRVPLATVRDQMSIPLQVTRDAVYLNHFVPLFQLAQVGLFLLSLSLCKQCQA